jgi:uncharacterized protein with GYD domain
VPKYVVLLKWTDQGAANAKDTLKRYQADKRLFESKGAKFDAIFWTSGPYDIVAVEDIPDDETGAAIHLQLASTGNLRTVTMRAFTEEEMKGIVEKMN